MQSLESASSKRFSAIIREISKDGRSGFFRGIQSVFLGAGPAHALYFATYEFFKTKLVDETSSLRHLGSGISGACATVMSDAFMNPFDVVKQRMQISSAAESRGIFQTALKVLKTEGVGAFYVSYGTTLLLNIPFHAIQFPVYEAASKWLNPDKRYDPIVHMLSGAISGSTAAALTTPLDCIKTLLQTKGVSSDAAVRSASGMVAGAKVLFATRGIAGFYRGIMPRIFANMPATAICWTTYEYFKVCLGIASNNN